MSDELEIIYQSVLDDYSEEIRLSQTEHKSKKNEVLAGLLVEFCKRVSARGIHYDDWFEDKIFDFRERIIKELYK